LTGTVMMVPSKRLRKRFARSWAMMIEARRGSERAVRPAKPTSDGPTETRE
jgi:hypothetical protein